MYPKLALSEAALRLVSHARFHMAGELQSDSSRQWRLGVHSLSGNTNPAVWRPEVALVRMVSTVEAYIDAISMDQLGRLVDANNTTVGLLVRDFEVTSSAAWPARIDSFYRFHNVKLRERKGWQGVDAAIEVRNCLAHGLGRLTARQRRKSGLAQKLAPIDVTVGSGRMFLGRDSLDIAGQSCCDFIIDVDSMIC